MKLLSTEAEGVNEAIPDALRPKLVNDVGRVGALLGLQAPQSQDDSGKGDQPARGYHSIYLCTKYIGVSVLVPQH